MKKIQTHIVAFVVALMVAPVIVMGGPAELEALLLPVAKEQGGQIDSDDGKQICWTMKFHKIRAARPRFFVWQMVLPNGRRFTLAQRRVKGDANTPGKTTGQGFVGTLRNCANKPIEYSGPYYIEALAHYYSFHSLWLVPRRVGPYPWPRVAPSAIPR